MSPLSACLLSSLWPCPDSPFTTVRHWSWQIQAGSFLPPYFTHYLNTDSTGSTGVHSLFRHSSCQQQGRKKRNFLAVTSFQPDRTGGEKWLPFAVFCQAITQHSVCCNKCEKQSKSERLALAGG